MYKPIQIIIVFIFIFINCLAQKNFYKEFYHAKYKTLKQALRNPLRAKNVNIDHYSDSIFPNAELSKLKNVENLCLRSLIHYSKKYAKENPDSDSLFPFPKIRIDTTALKQLSHLKYLTVAGFDFSYFVNNIGALKGLVGLAINIGTIDSLPKEIGQFKNLVVLDLRLNNINSLPKEILQLNSLKYLNLANNSFTTIPVELLSIKNLEEVNLTNAEMQSERGAEFSWPFVIHLNKIDYSKEIELLTSFIKLQNVKHIFISHQTTEEKNRIKSKVTDKNLLSKIKWGF